MTKTTPKMKNKTALILIAVALCIGLISGVFIHRGYVMKHFPTVQHDTVTVWKTAEISSPAPTESHKADTPISLPASDVKPSPRDSSLVEILPDIVTIQGKLADSISYKVVMNGVQPRLESLAISYPERAITRTVAVPYKGWKASLKGEIFAVPAQTFSAYAFTGIEFSYHTSIFHFGIDAGCAELYNSGQGWGLSPYLGGSVTIDLYKFSR